MYDEDKAWDAFDAHCVKMFGYTLAEAAAIKNDAPVSSVRDNVRSYFGKGVPVNADDAKEILITLDGHAILEAHGVTFYDPNDFITAVAACIEV